MAAAGLFTGAAASYGANCALGTIVATGLVDTRNIRWVHHALYVSTVALTVAAMWSGFRPGAPRSARVAALMSAPAGVPLALIPALDPRSSRHVIAALAAAPFLGAALVRSWR